MRAVPFPALVVVPILSAAAFSPLPASRSPLFRAQSGSPVGALNVASVEAPISTSGEDSPTKDDSPTIATQAEETTSEDRFDWFKSWYPIVPVEYLDPEKPQHFKLLNIDLVVWNDGHVEGGEFGSKKDRAKGAKRTDGVWRVFADSCPHRKVPLSEGRVEDDGSLLCSYHAWRFSGDGDLKAVPQAQSETELNMIKANPKSKCNAYPAKVINGLLWVWPESGSDAILESELTDVPMMKLPHEEDDSVAEERVFAAPWNFRQLPYGHDYFLENVVDPAHVPASHHNIVGDRYAGTQPLHISTKEALTKAGFSIEVMQEGMDKPSTTKFTAPCHVQISSPFGDDGARQILELYSSPSTPGFCNHVGRQVIVKSKNGETPKMLKTFLLPMPKWLLHVIGNTFLNQDALFLHAQERALASSGEYSTVISEDAEPQHYNQMVLPMTADKGVINFRNWVRRKAGGRIPYRNNPTMPPPSHDVVFDIYNSHTKDCKYCMDALKNLRKARFASYFAAAAMAVARPAKLGTIGTSAFVAVFGGLGLLLNKLIGAMHRMEFSHAEND